MRTHLWALVLLVACKRDPVLIGVWDVVVGSVDGEEQQDYGTMEFRADGGLVLVARYSWELDHFEPRLEPTILELGTDAGASGPSGSISKRGEVHTVEIADDTYEIEDYVGSSCLLIGRDAAVPGFETAEHEAVLDPSEIPRGDVRYALER